MVIEIVALKYVRTEGRKLTVDFSVLMKVIYIANNKCPPRSLDENSDAEKRQIAYTITGCWNNLQMQSLLHFR